MLRPPAPREIRRAPHDDEPEVPGNRDGDHVPIDHLAELDPGVVSRGDDVHRRIAHCDVEVDVRLTREEAGEHRPVQKAFRGVRHIQS